MVLWWDRHAPKESEMNALLEKQGDGRTDRVVEANQVIRARLAEKRHALMAQGRPLVGDVVLWPNNQRRRISHDFGDSYQTSFMTAGSFYSSSGHGSFSGTLQPPVFAEFLIATDEVSQEDFWFFSENRAGAGRGVQCKLPCRVWRLEPFRRTRKEAESHPRALSAKEFWGRDKYQYNLVVESIMNPRVIDEPDYF